jgi:hypothetical protein
MSAPCNVTEEILTGATPDFYERLSATRRTISCHSRSAPPLRAGGLRRPLASGVLLSMMRVANACLRLIRRGSRASTITGTSGISAGLALGRRLRFGATA